jgi:26S proteasome regulatory subunit N7
MGSDPQYIKFPNLSIAQHVFNLSNPACAPAVQQSSLKKLQDVILENKMAPFYRHLAHPTEGILNNSGEGVTQHPQNGGNSTQPLITSNLIASRKAPVKIDFPWDEQLYQSLLEDNKKELETFQKEEDDAEEAAGETEVQAARGKRAEFWARVGDKVRIFRFMFLSSFFDLLANTSIPIGQSCRIPRSPPRKDRIPGHQD